MGDFSSDTIKWVIGKDEYSTASIASEYQKLPEPKYSVFGERIRHVAPSSMQCSMFCGGKQCKYCNPSKFKKEPNQDAIAGLYSAWVTPEILATSRPSTESIKQYNIIEQFHKHGIRSIINLQHPGEHAACGFGLEDGGFSYIAQDFMDNDVFFYNFGWNDYGVRSLQSILDMVKVFDFALSNGKAAVHCHAGLGRTGVLIACYLIYSIRATSHEAIMRVREARPKAIQTRGQINCVNDFSAYIKPMWKIFSDDDDDADYTFTLKQFMNRQRNLLHGEESRTLRFIPKVVYIICGRLLTVAEIDFDLSKSAMVTHFGFMRNSSLKSFQKGRNENNDEDCLDAVEEAKSHLPVNEDTDLDENNKLNEESKHKFHSEEEIMGNDAHLLTSLEAQYKAHSTPNVTIINPPTSSAGDSGEETMAVSLKKGSVQLEPIVPRKSKRKKKKGMRDRLKELKESGDNEDMPTNENGPVQSSLPPILRNLDSSFNSSTKTFSGTKKMGQNYKADSISLASFSSTANGDLTQTQLILKYLAFRSSDITISNHVERYKRKLNSEDTAWDNLSEETNPAVLTCLLWAWLYQLHTPVLDNAAIESFKKNMKNHEEAVDNIDRDVWKLTKFFIIFLSKLSGKQEHFDRILRRFSLIMTDDDLTKEAVEEGCSLDDASPGLIFFMFTSSWLKVMQS